MDLNGKGNTMNLTKTERALVTSGPIIDEINFKILINNLLPSFIYMLLSLVIGTVGNLLVIYVYYFKRSKGTSRLFIMSLAIFDLIHCLVSVTIELDLLMNFIKYDKPFACKLSRYVSAFCTNSTTIVLIAIAVDRYKKICKPMLSSMPLHTSHVIVATAVVFGMVTAVPMVILYGTRTLVLGPGLAGNTCSIENIFLTTMYPTALIVFIFIGHVISDVTLVTLYSCVGNAVCRQKRTRRSLREKCCPNEPIDNRDHTSSLSIEDQDSGHRENSVPLSKLPSVDCGISTRISLNQNRIDRRQRPGNITSCNKGSFDKGRKLSLVSLSRRFRRRRSSESSNGSMGRGQFLVGKTTLMLFFVSLVFMVSYLPFCVVMLLTMTRNNLYFNLNDAEKAAYQLFLRSYFLSSVLNPIVYCFVSVNFRKEVLRLIDKCRPKCFS